MGGTTVVSPLQGSIKNDFPNPGRCPGLSNIAPLGLEYPGLSYFAPLVLRSPAIPHALQVLVHLLLQHRPHGEAFAQGGGQTRHFFLKRFIVFFHIFRADIATGSEHMTMGADFLDAGGFAEAGNVLVALALAPRVVGVSLAMSSGERFLLVRLTM